MLLWCSTWHKMPQVEFCRTTWIVKLTDLEEDIQEILLWRAGLLGHEGELKICFHHHNCLEMCLREEINTAVEYLDHISTGCKVKNKCLSWWQKNSKQNIRLLTLDIPLLVSVLKNMIISWRVIRMTQMLSRMKQIMTTFVKRQGRSSISDLTLWVSPLSIYMVLLNTVGLQLQKINWTEQLKY